VRRDPFEDVGDVFDRVDVVLETRRDDREESGDVVACFFVADEEVVLSVMRSSA
jgi:hypothetical protein